MLRRTRICPECQQEKWLGAWWKDVLGRYRCCRKCHGEPARGGKRWQRWLGIHDTRLRELAVHYSSAQIAAQLTEEFGIYRTDQAVRMRLRRRGISMALPGISLTRAAEFLGRSKSTLRLYYNRGWFRTTIHPRGEWSIAPQDLEALVRAHPECVGPGASARYRALAAAVRRDYPRLTVEETAARLGHAGSHIRALLAKGVLQGYRGAPTGRTGGGLSWHVYTRSIERYERARAQKGA